MNTLLRRMTLPLAAVLLATAAPAGPARAADPAHGQVIVFSHERKRVTVTTNPAGCTRLPALAHVLVNLTDRTVRLYADPLCLVPSAPFVTVRPGYGSHVSAVGSFAV